MSRILNIPTWLRDDMVCFNVLDYTITDKKINRNVKYVTESSCVLTIINFFLCCGRRRKIKSAIYYDPNPQSLEYYEIVYEDSNVSHKYNLDMSFLVKNNIHEVFVDKYGVGTFRRGKRESGYNTFRYPVMGDG